MTAVTAALEKIGYSGIYHMTSLFKNPPDAWLWREAYLAQAGKRPPFKREDWDHLLGNMQGAIDMPAVGVLPSLIEAYPEAKVLIWERDVDKWYESMQATIISHRFHPMNIVLWLLDWELFRPVVSLQMTMGPIMFGPKGLEEKNAKEVYRKIYEDIRKLVPEERRLDFRLEEGWEPVCKFLGKEVPNEPFPRINEGKEWVERSVLMRNLGVQRVLKRFTPYMLASAVVLCGIAWTRVL